MSVPSTITVKARRAVRLGDTRPFASSKATRKWGRVHSGGLVYFLCMEPRNPLNFRGQTPSEMSDGFYRRTLQNFSRKSRRQKFELFAELLHPRATDSILDVGLSGRVFAGYTLEDFYEHPEHIVGGGVDIEEVGTGKQKYPKVKAAVFDGCALPFRNRSFDIVFSNAVIEHVLGDGNQERFASEIMRVGKSWFVTTPNYWFPFESHYHLPLIQFMPEGAQRIYNRMFGTHIPRGEVQELALLSARKLQRLFPSGSIARLRVSFWPETLIAYYIDAERRNAQSR